jgi:hypothetical protein
MPGDWLTATSIAGRVVCDSGKTIVFQSSNLAQQLEALAAEYYLLRAHYSQVRGACYGARQHSTAIAAKHVAIAGGELKSGGVDH